MNIHWSYELGFGAFLTLLLWPGLAFSYQSRTGAGAGREACTYCGSEVGRREGACSVIPESGRRNDCIRDVQEWGGFCWKYCTR